jgi:hypothetical protein
MRLYLVLGNTTIKWLYSKRLSCSPPSAKDALIAFVKSHLTFEMYVQQVHYSTATATRKKNLKGNETEKSK